MYLPQTLPVGTSISQYIHTCWGCCQVLPHEITPKDNGAPSVRGCTCRAPSFRGVPARWPAAPAISVFCWLPCFMDLTFLIFSFFSGGAHSSLSSRKRVFGGKLWDLNYLKRLFHHHSQWQCYRIPNSLLRDHCFLWILKALLHRF